MESPLCIWFHIGLGAGTKQQTVAESNSVVSRKKKYMQAKLKNVLYLFTDQVK